MSPRSRRLHGDAVPVERFTWSATGSGGQDAAPAAVDVWASVESATTSAGVAEPIAPPPPAPFAPSPEHLAQLAALERDAFTKGYAQGERAGLEAGGKRAEAMLRRLAQTLDELSRLRDNMVRQTERELVHLALAIARRVLQREVTVDPELTAALAHIALERLGGSAPATVRLHPDDYDVVAAGQFAPFGGRHVQVQRDTGVARGGCLVESEFGFIDASVDAQLDEIARAVLGDAPATAASRRGVA